MQIRKAKIGDVPRIAEMCVDFMHYHRRIDAYFTPAKDAKRAYLEYFKKSIYSNNKLLLVAVEKEKIVGYALAKLAKAAPVMKMKKYGFINDIYLKKRYRGSGVAGNFLDVIFAWFRSKKIKNVEMYVLPKNELGRKAWKKYGFREYTLRLRKKI